MSPCMDGYMRFTSSCILLTPLFLLLTRYLGVSLLARREVPSRTGREDVTDLTDACLPATHPHSNNRRDGWVPAFTRMLSNTMTLDEAYPTKQVWWWFLDIHTYLPVLCAVVYYPDELGDMLLSRPYSRPGLVRSAGRGNLGTQRELHFVPLYLRCRRMVISRQGKGHVRRQAAGKHILRHALVMTTPRSPLPCPTKGVGQERRKRRISELEATAAEKEVV